MRINLLLIGIYLDLINDNEPVTSVTLSEAEKNKDSEKSSEVVGIQPNEEDYEMIKLISNGAYG